MCSGGKSVRIACIVEHAKVVIGGGCVVQRELGSRV
jgi:hypothetical protein